MNANRERRPTQFLLPATIVLAICLVAALPASAVDECCTIVSTDSKTGMVTAQSITTGETFEFTVGNQLLLEKLEPGTAFGTDYLEGLDAAPDTLEKNWGDGWSERVARVDVQESYAEEVPSELPEEVPAVRLADGVTLHSAALKRRGSRALKLTFEITNDSSSQVTLIKYGMVNNGQLELTLIDFDAGKRYEIVTDDNGSCVCSRADLFVGAGATKSFWAHFASPPSGVAMLTLDIAGGVPVDDIPIQ